MITYIIKSFPSLPIQHPSNLLLDLVDVVQTSGVVAMELFALDLL